MFGSRMTIGIGAALWCLVCGGGHRIPGDEGRAVADLILAAVGAR